MKQTINSIFQPILLSFVLFITIVLLLQSCHSKSSQGTESELIIKVNAVHQQLMKQGNISEEERQAILSLATLVSSAQNRTIESPITLDMVDSAPVYPGCEGLSKDALGKCFIESVENFVVSNFDQQLKSRLSQPGAKKLEVIFMIDQDGKLHNTKVRGDDLIIQAEVLRVLKMLPTMQPAMIYETRTDMAYSLNLFNVLTKSNL
ncbi:MAG: hypothetical protein AAFO69_21965 [Bacteroidota bacterium]